MGEPDLLCLLSQGLQCSLHKILPNLRCTCNQLSCQQWPQVWIYASSCVKVNLRKKVTSFLARHFHMMVALLSSGKMLKSSQTKILWCLPFARVERWDICLSQTP